MEAKLNLMCTVVEKVEFPCKVEPPTSNGSVPPIILLESSIEAGGLHLDGDFAEFCEHEVPIEVVIQVFDELSMKGLGNMISILNLKKDRHTENQKVMTLEMTFANLFTSSHNSITIEEGEQLKAEMASSQFAVELVSHLKELSNGEKESEGSITLNNELGFTYTLFNPGGDVTATWKMPLVIPSNIDNDFKLVDSVQLGFSNNMKLTQVVHIYGSRNVKIIVENLKPKDRSTIIEEIEWRYNLIEGNLRIGEDCPKVPLPPPKPPLFLHVLVLEEFRNCVHKTEFCETAYELHRALTEIREIYRDNHPDSPPWLTQLRAESDSASFYIKDFLQKWEHVLKSYEECGILTSKCAKEASLFKYYASIIAYSDSEGISKEVTTQPCRNVKDIDCYLDEVQRQLIEKFRCPLRVWPYHVAQVVSNMTDVPLTQIHSFIPHLKEMGMYKVKLRVVNRDNVINKNLKSGYSEITTRPSCSFLLFCQPGVGKTKIAKAIAEHWYCDISRLVEIKMSEYAASHELYEWSKREHHDFLDHSAEMVRRHPYSVIVLKTIEKAFPFVIGVLPEILSNDAPKDVKGNHVDFKCSNSGIYKKITCRATLSMDGSFCKRCSCCTCYLSDDNKDPSFWFKCTSGSVSRDSCGIPCHIECTQQRDNGSVVGVGLLMQCNGSYYSAYYGMVSGTLGCWKKQLIIAKDARDVDVLCHRLLLSYVLLNGTFRFIELHEVVKAAKAKLEVVPVNNGVSDRMVHGIVSRLSIAVKVQQRFCFLAIERADELIVSMSTPSTIFIQSSLPVACIFVFKKIPKRLAVTKKVILQFIKLKNDSSRWVFHGRDHLIYGNDVGRIRLMGVYYRGLQLNIFLLQL